MAMSEWVNRNQKVALPLALIILAGAAAMILSRGKSAGENPKEYYYDLGAKQIIVGNRTDPSPIDAPGGGKAYKVAVFACGECGDKVARFPGWIMKYNALAAEAVVKQRTEPGADVDPQITETIDRGTEIAFDPGQGEPQWVPLLSPQALPRKQQLLIQCPDGKPGVVKSCDP